VHAMSQRNEEIVRRHYAHLSETGGLLAELLHPEFEFSFAWMEGRGIDAASRATAEWIDTFEHWDIAAVEIIELGPKQLVAIVHDRGRPKGSAAEIQNEFAHLWTFRDGLAIRFEAFTEKADALEAAGRTQ
jgi:ketosteroid isomerase-like protein